LLHNAVRYEAAEKQPLPISNGADMSKIIHLLLTHSDHLNSMIIGNSTALVTNSKAILPIMPSSKSFEN
jgi:hypothetical protein